MGSLRTHFARSGSQVPKGLVVKDQIPPQSERRKDYKIDTIRVGPNSDNRFETALWWGQMARSDEESLLRTVPYYDLLLLRTRYQPARLQPQLHLQQVKLQSGLVDSLA